MKHDHHSHHEQEHGHHEQTDAEHSHEHHGEHHLDAHLKPPAEAAYYCPMCEGVESDKPGNCPKCGMALERNPADARAAKTLYTCPMHPQIEQDHPGSCPICGMALEPKTVSAEPEDSTELRDMTRRLWVSAVLALPVFALGMLHFAPSLEHVGHAP